MIVKHLLDTLILMIWMLVIGLAFMGWGELVRHWLKFKPSDHQAESTATQVLCNIWFGLCICISVTELLHFFFAIMWVVSLGVLGAGLAYSLTSGNLRHVGRLWRELLVKPFSIARGLYGLAFLAACFIWISVAMAGPTNYDSGLYHFGSIKWLNEHSITYGLVNLHTRLAYNQSYFALIALLNFSPIYDRAYAGTGVFLFILTAATCVQLVRDLTSKPAFLLFALLVLAGGFVLKASSPTPDLAVGLFQVVILLILLKVLLIPTSQTLLPLLLTLCVTALTIKLSMVVFCAATVCVAHRRFWLLLKSNRTLVVRLFIICGLILVMHTLRGYALSGVPFYPSTFAGLWALPYTPSPARVLAEANSIYSWARLPGVAPAIVLSNWDWIKPWLSSLPTRFLVLTGLGAALFISNLVLFRQIRKDQRQALWLYLPLILSVGFWFLTAPDVRFLGLIPELTVALGMWLLCSTGLHYLDRKLTILSAYSKLLLRIGVIAFSCGAILFIFKIYTGISFGHYFYLNEVLFGLSQIGINLAFALTALAGLLIVSNSKLVERAQRSVSNDNFISTQFFYVRIQQALLVLFVCATINYIANLALFKTVALVGWASIPTEPYDEEKLSSGLHINVPKSDDLCWSTPLPCLPRQQFNDKLEAFDLLDRGIKLNAFRLAR
jgi:hypothetical protein